jgi:ribosome-associated protein
MKDDLFVKNGITIPGHELEITASRAGGPGGQHVNKTSSRITVRWNVKETSSLDNVQKGRVLENLKAELTTDGEIILHSSTSRSQQQNKKMALERLADKLRTALYVPKKRRKMIISKKAKEVRLQQKKQRGVVKKMRSKKLFDE